MSKAITRSLTGLIRGLEDRVWRPDDFLPDGATGILSAVLDWSQFEACGVKGAADVKDMDAVLVIKDAENNVLSKENISVSYWWWAEPVLTRIPTDSGGRNPAIWYSIKIWKKEAMLSWQLEALLLLYAVLYAVCAPWARSNGWKSQTRPGSGKCLAEQRGKMILPYKLRLRWAKRKLPALTGHGIPGSVKLNNSLLFCNTCRIFKTKRVYHSSFSDFVCPAHPADPAALNSLYSIDLADLAVRNRVLTAESFKVSGISDQHYFMERTGWFVQKAGDLFPGADTAAQDGLLFITVVFSAAGRDSGSLFAEKEHLKPPLPHLVCRSLTGGWSWFL